VGDRLDVWQTGGAYESYIGRWSRFVADEFLHWLAIPPAGRWLDVGCGTGSLTQAVLQATSPSRITGVDLSNSFIGLARRQISDDRAQFIVGNAQALPVETGGFDAVVSGLALNFFPQPAQALAEIVRASKPGGLVAVYIWDYAGKMEMLSYFWSAAVALDPSAYDLDEGRRFPICQPSPLQEFFRNSGLKDVEVRPIDIITRFRNFDDYWSPFLGGQGPAPGYTMSLSEAGRAKLRENIRAGLPFALDGSISLEARAWAARGIK
jgi:SAM-dependent methyltransferase